MNRRLFSIAAALALLGSVSVARASDCTLSGLNWMVGDWQSAADPDRAQEHWVRAPDEVLMGTAWEFPAERSGYAELMTIRATAGVPTMYLRHFDGALSRAWEGRSAPMTFIASKCGANSIVFDGQFDHSGEHLTYERSGDNLIIMGDFLHHGVPDHEQWQMVRG